MTDHATDQEFLSQELERHRPRLRAMAYHMLGSVADTDDALQEVWLRIGRTPGNSVCNPGGWLTTVLTHTCLDLLRARRARHEDPVGVRLPDPIVVDGGSALPEAEALVRDSVGLAIQVVLSRLDPAERIAVVLHDSFGVPFDDIAVILDRSPAAVRQLASRARRRVRMAPVPDCDPPEQRRVVDAFFAAARRGDLDALIEVLDPDVVLRGDLGVAGLREITGARAAAEQAALFAHDRAVLRPVLVNGAAGVVVSLGGRAAVIMAFIVANSTIVEIDVLADRSRVLAALSN